MNFHNSIFITLLTLLIVITECKPPEKINFYLLAIPESAIEAHMRKARQDDGDGDGDGVITPPLFQESGAYVGQIVSGIFNADIRSIFTGSANFIPEQGIRTGVTSILSNIANPIYDFMFRVVNGTQYYLGITTPKPSKIKNNTTNTNTTSTLVRNRGTSRRPPIRLEYIEVADALQQTSSIPLNSNQGRVTQKTTPRSRVPPGLPLTSVTTRSVDEAEDSGETEYKT